jgi:hypothetical protein
MFTSSARTRYALLILVALAAVFVVSNPVPAPAAPGNNAADDEGGSAALRAQLEKASRGYTEAEARLTASRQRQGELARQQRITEAKADMLSKDVQVLAAATYRGGRMSLMTAALDSGSMSTFVKKAAIIDLLSRQNSERITGLRNTRATIAKQQRTIDGEIRVQEAQEKAMAKRKADAERALTAVGGDATTGFSGGPSRAARSTPRNPDGSLRPESCSLKDPTTGGCLSPRMLNALQQARAAGFSRYTRCFRGGGAGEHSKGRACDFAAAANGFGGTATGGDRTYGNRLAAWCVNNADRLGVLYVIWFRQIWMPGTGWRAYSGGGSPAAAHTNHVHLSVQ